MIEFEHSPLGGSAAYRFLNCGASFLLQRLLMLHEEFESPVTSEFADKGNAAHELGAHCLIDDAEPFEYIGERIGKYLVHPDDLDPEAVAVYVNYCRSIMDNNPHGKTIVEQTFHLRQIHPLFKGTVDFGHWVIPIDRKGAWAGGGGLWLVDYKNGEGIGVQAYRSPQLLYYACLLIWANQEFHGLARDFPVHLGIVQPNYWGLFDEPEIWTTTLGEVVDWGRDILLPAMNRLWADKREMVPVEEFVSGEHCQFCPVMLDCPKLRMAFETYAQGDEFIEMLTNEELSKLYAMKADARRYGNELEKVVYARKITGQDIPSAKLVEKMVHRTWKVGAETAAQQRFGENAYNPRKLKSPAQMEKLSSDGKAFALEYGFKPDSERLTVAPLDDRRPEAKPIGNEQVFKKFAVPLEEMGW